MTGIPRVPRQTIIILIALNVVSLTTLAAMAPGSENARNVLILQPFFWVCNTLIVTTKRRHLRRPFAGKASPTGQAITPPDPDARGDQSENTWIGAGSVPTGFGRLNVGRPALALDQRAGELTIRVRPRGLGITFGSLPLAYAAADIEAIVPVRGRGKQGLAICPRDSPESYFWTKEEPAVLAALVAGGFPVSWDERKLQRFSRSRAAQTLAATSSSSSASTR